MTPRTFAGAGLVLAACLALMAGACARDAAEDGATTESEAPIADVAPGWRMLEPAPPPAQRPELASIAGHVILQGEAPGNRVLRMGMDPKCAASHQGEIVAAETVVVTLDGDLANVFVHLEGEFPEASVPPERPVQIDQVGCVYVPHVVGARVGQTIEIHNADDLAHNLHATSRAENGFNVSQPVAGLVYRFQPQHEEVPLHLACDIHRWMTSYIGVVDHPYFDVSARDGTFTIRNVPPGTYTIHAWHELYGDVRQTVELRAGETADVSFAYDASQPEGGRGPGRG